VFPAKFFLLSYRNVYILYTLCPFEECWKMSCHIFLSNENKVVIFFSFFFIPLGTQHAVTNLQHIANKTQEASKLGSLTIYIIIFILIFQIQEGKDYGKNCQNTCY